MSLLPFRHGLLALCLLTTAAVQAAPERPLLHPLFSDHAVLQRDRPLKVWGWAEPGTELIVRLSTRVEQATAGADGRWSCQFGPFPASAQGRTLTVQGSDAKLHAEARDLLFGDVWLCSGQSNMEMGLVRCNEDDEIAKANHPNLRLLTIPHEVAYKPQSTFDAKWRRCSPEAILEDDWGGFSATAYFFGKKLQEELDIPIGLIHSSWGGTMIEAWSSLDALKAFPNLEEQLKQVEQLANSDDPRALAKMMDDWFLKHDIGTQQGWHKGTADTSDWREVEFPGSWRDCGIPGHEGITWIQREFAVPADWVGKAMVIQLGTIADTDTTWINGVEVGRTNSFEVPTQYLVAAGTIKAGRNVITLRITNAGGGGIHNKDEIMSVSPLHITPREAVNLEPILSGKWKLQETATKDKTGRPIAGNPRVSGVLYNGMIAPLAPYSMTGVIWYQGEANASQAAQYHKLLPALITDWRKHFERDDLAFHIVSLAAYQKPHDQPRDNAWADLREAQAMTAKQLPHCGLAVTIDIGDANDIHPKNKRDVGKRLALSALANTYGKDVVGSGPWFRSMVVEADQIRVVFDHVADSLVFKGPSDRSFAIAGKDGEFVWAKAKIEGKSVVVSSPKVPNPVHVRYAWDSNPQACLYNSADLPAVPFRSDR